MSDKYIEKLLNLTLQKRELDTLLSRLGFIKRSGKGSHERWHREGHAFTVATHNKEVPKYILRQIRDYLKQNKLL